MAEMPLTNATECDIETYLLIATSNRISHHVTVQVEVVSGWSLKQGSEFTVLTWAPQSSDLIPRKQTPNSLRNASRCLRRIKAVCESKCRLNPILAKCA